MTDAFTGKEEACLGIYKSAHAQSASKYNLLEASTKAEAEKYCKTAPLMAATFEARAQTIANIRDKPDVDQWFRADRAVFAAMDADNNKFLDKSEFENLLKENFDMDSDQAAEAFKKYDVDHEGTIGVYEFCQMLAIWHSQYTFHKVKHEGDAEAEVIRTITPCSCCDGCFVQRATEFGCLCSLCTLGLSWIPCYCIAGAAASNLTDPEKMEKIEEKAAKHAQKAAKKSTAKKLMKGPPANVLKASACAKE